MRRSLDPVDWNPMVIIVLSLVISALAISINVLTIIFGKGWASP